MTKYIIIVDDGDSECQLWRVADEKKHIPFIIKRLVDKSKCNPDNIVIYEIGKECTFTYKIEVKVD